MWKYPVSLVKHVSSEGRRIETGKFKILKISPPESLKNCKSIIDFIYQKKNEHQRWIREVTIFFRENVSKKYCLNDGRDFVQNLNVLSSEIVLFCFQYSMESWFILSSIVFWSSWQIIYISSQCGVKNFWKGEKTFRGFHHIHSIRKKVMICSIRISTLISHPSWTFLNP